ncbi:MAG: DNA-directed RNA polymerase subunit alpha [Planctomycetes bacterium RBG_16_59_8]|nr:MAG: DNA-directed RNA polymerase subunit alpha [Planctomycetes bacterium RBG_16_59_8]
MRVRWKEFELPTRVALDDKTATETYGSFVIEPFERGFGATIGNSLRRILYSSIEGCSVTALKIKGVHHEFSVIKGIVEDVTDIVLNLKQLVVKMNGEAKKTIHLEASKKGDVKAAHITPDADVEIVNQDLHICTLSENVNFSAEIEIRRGRRYMTTEELFNDQHEIGVIPIDANFSPVKKVKYRVENTRVGKLTSYDKLIMDIWTNGIVAPEDALVEASKIMRKHLNPFVQYFELGKELQINERKEEDARRKEKETEQLKQKLSMSVSELDLSVRSANCLSSEHIETIGELVSHSESDLLKVRNFGKTSLREVKKKLSDLTLQLGMDVKPLVEQEA